MLDHEKFQGLIEQLYATVTELKKMFPRRHFTPDGHMVGSIGECLVSLNNVVAHQEFGNQFPQ